MVGDAMPRVELEAPGNLHGIYFGKACGKTG